MKEAFKLPAERGIMQILPIKLIVSQPIHVNVRDDRGLTWGFAKGLGRSRAICRCFKKLLAGVGRQDRLCGDEYESPSFHSASHIFQQKYDRWTTLC
jgi:hypothetical protein